MSRALDTVDRSDLNCCFSSGRWDWSCLWVSFVFLIEGRPGFVFRRNGYWSQGGNLFKGVENGWWKSLFVEINVTGNVGSAMVLGFWVGRFDVESEINEIVTRDEWGSWFRKMNEILMWLTINRSSVVGEIGSEWVIWWVGSVDAIENAWGLMRSMSMEVSGLQCQKIEVEITFNYNVVISRCESG